MPFAFNVLFGVNILLLQASWTVGRTQASQNKGLLCWLIDLKNCATNAHAQLIYMRHNWWQIMFCPGNVHKCFISTFTEKRTEFCVPILSITLPSPCYNLQQNFSLEGLQWGSFYQGGSFMPRFNQKELPGCRFSPNFSVQIVMQKSEKWQILLCLYFWGNCGSSMTFDVFSTKLSRLFHPCVLHSFKCCMRGDHSRGKGRYKPLFS